MVTTSTFNNGVLKLSELQNAIFEAIQNEINAQTNYATYRHNERSSAHAIVTVDIEDTPMRQFSVLMGEFDKDVNPVEPVNGSETMTVRICDALSGKSLNIYVPLNDKNIASHIGHITSQFITQRVPRLCEPDLETFTPAT